jgi:hypothetical protein
MSETSKPNKLAEQMGMLQFRVSDLLNQLKTVLTVAMEESIADKMLIAALEAANAKLREEVSKTPKEPAKAKAGK